MSISFKNIAFGILIGFLLSSAALVFASTWTGPTAEPPASNVAAPINVGATTQTKTGSLLIDNILEADNLSVWGSIILGGVGNYLNFGTTAGTSGYGIRDNGGVMQVKNNNGAWAAIATTTAVNAGGTFKVCAGTDNTSSGCAPATSIPITCSYSVALPNLPDSGGRAYSGDFMRWSGTRWQFWYHSTGNYYNCENVLLFTPN